jgi:hypothetical protein
VKESSRTIYVRVDLVPVADNKIRAAMKARMLSMIYRGYTLRRSGRKRFRPTSPWLKQYETQAASASRVSSTAATTKNGS